MIDLKFYEQLYSAPKVTSRKLMYSQTISAITIATAPRPPALTNGCSVGGGDLHRDAIRGGQILDETHLPSARVLAKRVGGTLKPHRGN